jgi:signal transduction histidine kinase
LSRSSPSRIESPVSATGRIRSPRSKRLAQSNRSKHNDRPPAEQVVEIETTASLLSSIDVEVRDNGPGIPEREIEPVLAGEETPLQHGSAIGLWMVRWAIDYLDGEIAFDTADDTGRGTTVRVTLDRKPLADARAAVSDVVGAGRARAMQAQTVPSQID